MKCRDLGKIDLPKNVEPRKRYNQVKDVYGFDTETENGKVFLIGYYSKNNKEIHEGSDPDNVLKFLTQNKFRNTFNFFYNLTYDFQAIVKTLPYENIEELGKRNFTVYKKYYIKYIDNKLLSICKLPKKKKIVKFFDIAQYYNHMKLDTAGEKFLKINKVNLQDEGIDITRLSYNRYENDVVYRQTLRKYLFMDCEITYRLSEKMYSLMLDYLKPKAFYSQAYFSQQYFLENINKSYHLPNNHVLQYALNSYQGGRFETVKRGFFKNTSIYDIKSAYPFWHSQVPEVNKGKWKLEKEYDSNALVSLFKVKVDVNDLVISPLKYQLKDSLLIYPLGKMKELYVNKKEFEILREYSASLKIDNVWNYYDDEPEYPYKWLEKFYYLKEKLKREGKTTESWIPKILMNGFYGKMIQTIKQKYYTKELVEGNEENLVDYFVYNNQKIYEYQYYKAGQLFNPIVANEITANTRCQLFNSCKKYMDNVIGFQTDSIIVDKKINLNEGNKLGDWNIENHNEELVIIGSGVYQVLNKDKPKIKIRGFKKNLDIYKILKENPMSKEHELQIKRNYKLKKTMKMKYTDQVNKELLTNNDRFKLFNLLKDETRTFNINFDRKREWKRPFKNFKDVLNSQIISKPIKL
jgi:hypothetical protein